MDAIKPISAGIIKYPNLQFVTWKNRQLIISAHEKKLDGRKKLRKADHKE